RGRAGMPTGDFTRGRAAISLSLAPKSDAAKRAIGAARRSAVERGAQLPPDYLRSAAYPGAAKLGRGEGYDYPHDWSGHVSGQELMPDALIGERFSEPDDAEAELRH